MDPITLGIITAVVGAVVTVAAKRWIFPFFENCFKHIKNFFSGAKSEDHRATQKEKTEEDTPEEVEEEDEIKSITTNDKTIKDLEDDIDLESDNDDIKPHSNTEISVEGAAKQEHDDINKATNKLMAIKNKLHNSDNHQITPEQHYHNHQIVGSHTKHIVAVEDAHHRHHNGNALKKDDDEEAGR